MDISKAEEVLSDLVESTSRMDGRPLQYTTEEFKEAYAEFVKHVNAARIDKKDLKQLSERAKELADLVDITSEQIVTLTVASIGFVKMSEEYRKLESKYGGEKNGLHKDE